MHILFTRFPLESRFGGAEVQTLALMKGLRERGHTVAFLGSCKVLLEETGKLRIDPSASSEGELRIGMPPVTKWRAISFVWGQFAMRKKLYSQCSILHSQLHFDVVFMLSLSEKLLLTPYLYKQGIKVVWIEHDRVGRWLTWNPWLPKLRKLSKLATTIVVSDLSKKIYEKLGFQNVVAIPNGIDIPRLTSGKSQIINRKSPIFRIGCLSRLSHDKGVDILIDAVKDLPDVSLTIVGTGSEELALRRACLALPGCHIHAKEEHLADFYRSLDLFVLPSRAHDPFGLVVGEAMMLGIPVIVTDACGIAGYLQNGRDAVIVPAGSREELRKAIMGLKNNAEKRLQMGAMGKCTAEERFSMEKMVQKYEQVLSENSDQNH